MIGVIGALFLAIYFFDWLNGHEDRQREQMLLECVKNARDYRVAYACNAHWGPKEED